MKLCKDCKYFTEASNKEAFCLHSESVMYDDPIYGEHSRRTCRDMRLGGPDRTAPCGRYGKLFVAVAGFVPQIISEEMK
jgi:hypothetical protein